MALGGQGTIRWQVLGGHGERSARNSLLIVTVS